ncbi:cysteine-rich repeat secretory protein 55 [Phtheirospermum japonicum]|uniref:Cysteine-rich repeat secretory protein 55 n=1 Tax=Phtheirospermum japonicum TaxID=374723 RepID=A0A830BL87_9LAMI|nr:cysteine-rich repeat secretory protein 55 [Phtheirospermum japonicum]
MTLFLSSFFILSMFSLSINLTSPPHLLSLKCTPSSSNQTNPHRKIDFMKTLVDNLTSEAPKSQLITLNTTFGQERYTGLMQCRPGLGPKYCTLCAKTARCAISSLCQNSNSVSAWFDGCYVQILPTSFFNNAYTNISNHSCSSRASNQDPDRFLPALGTLLLKLRADVNIATHRGFSHGEIVYENSNRSVSKIYGLVECVRSLSPRECDSCVERAIDKLEFYCSGKNGGFVVYGPCLVRFDVSKFYDGGVVSYAGVGEMGNFSVWEGENENENYWGRKKIVVAYWGGGVACLLVFVLLVSLLRRTVLNRAKVGTSVVFAEFDANIR